MEQTLFYKINADHIPCVNAAETVVIKPPYIHFRRKPKEYIFYYVLSGEMHLYEDERSYTLRQNDFIMLDPAHVHYGKDATACYFNFTYIHFSYDGMKECETKDEELKRLLLEQRTLSLPASGNPHDTSASRGFDASAIHLPDVIIFPKYYHVKDNSVALTVMELINRLRESHSGILEYKTTQTGCLLLELFILLSRAYVYDFLFEGNTPAPRSMRKIDEMISFFNQSYPTDITSSLIEEKFACSFDYINRVFKKMLGKSIFNYLNGLRVEKAKSFLSSHIYSLSDVSEKTGFHDVYYFAKVFKKYTGMAPGVYMKQNLPL